jgi:stage II sporulation protein M
MKRKKSVKKENFIYGNFKQGLDYIKESKRYIWFAFILFLIFAVVGYLFPSLFEEEILKFIEELIAKTEGMSAVELIGFIFMNNLWSSFLPLFLGIVFGIFPIIALVANGYVLGFVANKTIAIEGPLVLWRLLPHGIFEIPAVMISMGLGLKLGSYLFVRNKKKNFIKWFWNSLRVLFFIIIPLLILAAIIEGFLMVVLS